MRKLLLFFAAITLFTMQLHAVAAFPFPRTVTQPDGTELTVQLNGDEYYHYVTTQDGYTIVKNAAGYYCYAELVNGKLAPTAHVAHDAAVRTTQELDILKSVPTYLIEENRIGDARKARAKRDEAMRASAIDVNNFRGLVILVYYQDCNFSRSDVKQLFGNMINQQGYTGYTNPNGTQNQYGHFTGSVRDYFYDNSMGVFDPQFDVVGPYRVTESVNSPQALDTNQGIMATERIMEKALVAADAAVDYSKYDANGDGIVDMFYVIVAGTGSHMGISGSENHMWPHASYIDYEGGILPETLDGMKFYRYACSTEFYDEGVIDGIGSMCHEFSHVLGFPDLYDADGARNGLSHDPGAWDIMAQGNYNNVCRTPAGYSAYERYTAGFGTPTVIDHAGDYTLDRLGTTNEFFIMPSEVPGVKFLFENRQPTKWDSGLPGHGMIVARMDSSSAAYAYWINNKVNAYSGNQCYEILRAGGSVAMTATNGYGDDYAHDPFPGTYGVTKLTNSTTPGLKVQGKDSQYSFISISESYGKIYFRAQRESIIHEDIEDFEPMPSTSNTNLKDVQGTLCKWSFINCNPLNGGTGRVNGSRGIAMKLPSAFYSERLYYDSYNVSLSVFNNSDTQARYQLEISTDGGNTWTVQNSSSGGVSIPVESKKRSTLTWTVSTQKEVGTQFRVTLVAGNSNVPCYADDFTIYYDDKCPIPDVQPVFGDVNNDGIVNVTDVNLLVSAALNGTCPDGYDLNGDGKINVTDINLCVSAVLNANN